MSDALRDQRVNDIINDTINVIAINSTGVVDPYWHEGYAVNTIGIQQVTKFDDIIETQALDVGVNADWLRAIIYLENSQGMIRDLVGEAGGAVIGRDLTSILPMNVNPSLWDGIGGLTEAQISADATLNIRAGALILKGIADRLAIEDLNFANVATLYNNTGTLQVGNYGARAQNILDNQLWTDPSGYVYRTFLEEASFEGNEIVIDGIESVSSFLGKMSSNVFDSFRSVSNLVGNVSDSIKNFIPGINLSDSSNFSGLTWLDTPSSLETATGYDISVLMALDGNQQWYKNFVQLDNGTEYFVYQNSMVFRTSSGLGYDYKIFNFLNQYFDSSLNHITTAPANTWLDFQTNFLGGASQTDNSGANWQGGTAIGGGNYQGNMPANILNGNGFFNVLPSGIITDFIMPGTRNFMQNAFDFFNLSNSVSNIYNGFQSVANSALNGLMYGGPLGFGLSLFTSVINTMMNWLRMDPLVLDIDGDGVELIKFTDSAALFDVDNDGTKEQTGWVGSDDAILVHDINANGVIDGIAETISEKYNGGSYTDGLVALKSLDSNNDNVFNSSDAAFSLLKIWQDSNGNGSTDANELKTLTEAGITSISLVRIVSSREEIEGNSVLSESVMTINSQSHAIAAVNFTTNSIGYEWNEVTNGIEIVLEGGAGSSLVIDDTGGATINISALSTDNVIGNIGNDTITGDGDSNVIVGGLGSDSLYGGAGDDLIIIDAEDDPDNIDAGDGFDIIKVAGSGHVVVTMSEINAEVFIGGAGNDTIISGATYNVFVTGGDGKDVIIGGSADDALSGEAGDDFIDGGLGDDVIRGHAGKDVLIGNIGEDFIDGGIDDDTLYGGEGEDLLIGNQGNDIIYGGDDYDVSEFSGDVDEYEVSVLSDGSIQVRDRVLGRDGTDILFDVEALNFKNVKEVPIDLDNPLPVNDIIEVTGSGPYVIDPENLVINDLDYQNNTITVTSVLSAVGGSVAINGSGDIVFTPDANYQGVRSFRYKIVDSESNVGSHVIDSFTGSNAETEGVVYLDEGHHPDDPLFYNQWYLNDINALQVWQDYTGAGVNIAVYEILGVMDKNHPDLQNNLSQETRDSNSSVDDHATLVSGIIAADDNDVGTIGVAYDSTLTGIHETLINNGSGYWSGTQAWDYYKYDVVNNSWGFTDPFTDSFIDFPDAKDGIFKYAAGYGRDGLGTVIVFAAGNERAEGGNANTSNWRNNEYVITVGGINKNTNVSSLELYTAPFSNQGANILISAPASHIQSTSLALTSENGSTFGDDYRLTEGTSFAVPIVSGVVALMLEANPELGFRDIQEILAYSARYVADSNTNWQTNSALNWNGGGLHFSHDYGFGNVDALAAVRMAETWIKQETAWSILSPNTPYSSGVINEAITDNGTITDAITIPSQDQAVLELVKVTIDLVHQQLGDLIIKLISPSGTESILLDRLEKDSNDSFDRGYEDVDFTYTFTSWAHMGELSDGMWTLEITDSVTGETGTLRSWSIDFTSDATDTYLTGLPPANTTYIYTDEYLGVTDAGRKTLIENSPDSEFEDDTINMAAVTADVDVDLTPGATSYIGLNDLTIDSDSYIDKIFTGDGDDTIIGNDLNNLLYSGRGDDEINGGDGNDWLFGKSGENTLTGGDGADRYVFQPEDNGITTIQDFDPINGDVIVLANFSESIDYSDVNISQVGSDVLITVDGADHDIILANTLVASINSSHFVFDSDFSLRTLKLQEYHYTGGNDSVWHGLAFNDVAMYGEAGNDSLYGGLGSDAIYGGDGNDTLIGSYNTDPAWNITTELNGGHDVLVGGDGNDTLYGGGGLDTLIGGAGNDTMYGHNGADIFYLQGGMDYAAGHAGVDRFIIGSATPANIIAGGSALMDIIADFDPLTEKIDLRGFSNLNSMADLYFNEITINSTIDSLMVFVGGNPSGAYGDTQYFTLRGVASAEDLSEENFIFNTNHVPKPYNDHALVDEDDSIVIDIEDLLLNDEDIEDGYPDFTKIVLGPQHGVLVNNLDGTYTYTPNGNFYGSDSFSYEVSDSENATGTATVHITIAPINDAPVVNMLDSFMSFTGAHIAIQPVFIDHDDDLLTYAITLENDDPLPTWLTYDEANNIISGSSPNTPENITIKIIASDGHAEEEHLITLSIESRTPSAMNDGVIGNEDSPITGNLFADNGDGLDLDPDGDSFIAVAGIFVTAEGGEIIISTNGDFEYTPPVNFNGEDTYSYTIVDPYGKSDTAVLTITVDPINDSPAITSNGSGSTASISVSENGTSVTTVTATDPDASTTYTYSIVGGADSAKFAINATTGVLSFISAPNYESATDSGANNVYDVQVQVSDGTLTDAQDIAVTVTNVNETPAITSNGSGSTASVSMSENVASVTTVTATDPDASTTYTYSISGGADSAKFTISSTTGVLSFVSAPNYESATDSGANNVYDVQVQVSDGTLTDTQDIAVTVTNVNETPAITSNGSGSTASISVSENGTSVTTVTATDPDASTTYTYSIVGGADSAKFAINATTGVLSFISAPNYESATDSGANNVYDVQVQVSDGTLTDTQDIAVTVTNVNESPAITSNGGGSTASVGITEGNTAVTTVAAADPDASTAYTYSIVGGSDSAKFTINSTTGVLSFVSAPSYASPTDAGANNVYDVQVRVSDGALTDTQDIAVTVSQASGVITGTSAGETITGTSGNDIIEGLSGNDTLNGGDGNDLLNGGDGNDNINGNNGTDTAVYEGAGSSVTVNLSLTTAQNTGGAGSDTLNSIENLIGSSYADSLIGNSNANVIDGGDGNDIIVGGTGDDTLIGGAGNDTADYSSHSSAVTVNLASGTASGGSGNDTLAFIENIIGSTQGDTITGDSNANILDGRTGHDTLNGGDGNDTLQGKDANDTLNGDGGDDVLEGGLGSDTLHGGNGTDQAFYGVASTNFVVYRDHADYVIVKDTGNTSDAFGYGGDKVYNDVESIVFNDITLDLTSLTFDINGMGWGTSTVTLTSATTYQGYNTRDIVNGYAGSDIIYGNLGNDDLYGNAGTDTLYGGEGNDNLYGGDSNDTLDGGAGSDTIDGGNGTDIATYASASSGVNVNLTTGVVTGGAGSDTISNVEQITGSAYADVIVASAVANVINGGDGEDIIEGTNDSVADTFNGGNGFDTLSYANATALVSINTTHATGSSINTDSHSGFENFIGSAYGDSITGNTANNFIWGGAGADTLRGGDGADTLYGEDGDDVFIGGAGNDYFDGGNGTDHLYLVDGTTAATVNLAVGTVSSSSDGSDTFINIEKVTGTIYADIIIGDAGNNIINGSSGNDLIEGGDGDDIISGANDTDTASYASATAAVTVNLATTTAQNTGGAGTDTLSLMENLIGSIYADTLTGSTVANVIEGGAGNDTINGGDGNDTLIGGAGDDSLTGGNGTDIASYEGATSAVTVNLATTTAQNTGGAGTDTLATIESLTGSSYGDTLTGNSSANTIAGGDGNDTVEGAGGNDILTGGNGTDTVSFVSAGSAITFNLSTTTSQNTVGAGSDTVSGFENVTGSAYNDTLTGDTGANLINGGAGNDAISGGDGNDILYGSSGLDALTGGNGADQFVFEAASAFSNIDTISDFSTGLSDAINLVDVLSLYDPMNDLITDFVQMTTSGSDTLLSVDRDGAGSTYSMAQIATLTGVTGLTDEVALVTNGNLIVS